MPDSESVAPKERISVVYKPAVTGKPQQELPLRILVAGDFKGHADEDPLHPDPAAKEPEKEPVRKPVNINDRNFDQVMEGMQLSLTLKVPNRLTGEGVSEQLQINDLKIKGMKGFEPDAIVSQVPELDDLLRIRQALVWLRGPLGNPRGFRKLLETTVRNQGLRQRLLKELGLTKKATIPRAAPQSVSKKET